MSDKKLSAHDAIKILDTVAAQVALPRKDHMVVLEALKVLKDLADQESKPNG